MWLHSQPSSIKPCRATVLQRNRNKNTTTFKCNFDFPQNYFYSKLVNFTHLIPLGIELSWQWGSSGIVSTIKLRLTWWLGDLMACLELHCYCSWLDLVRGEAGPAGPAVLRPHAPATCPQAWQQSTVNTALTSFPVQADDNHRPAQPERTLNIF